MSQLQPTTDPTNTLTPQQINSKDITNIIQELNGLQSTTGNIINQPTYTEINDGTNNRVLIGYNVTTGTWGIFATPAGTSIESATSPQQFSFSSDTQSLITVKGQQTATIPGAGSQPALSNGTQSATVAHGLSYTPSFLAYTVGSILTAPATFMNLNSPIPQNFQDSNNIYQVTVGTDATNIYFFNSWFTGANPSTIPGFTVTYYLLNVTA